MTLRDLTVGQAVVIDEVKGEGALRQHLLDMGVIPGEAVTVERFAPMGDPMEIGIHDYMLTLRLVEAENIKVHLVENIYDDLRYRERLLQKINKKREHPGFGEDGKYHVKADEKPLAEGTIQTFALAGNQNCGKTTLFNQLTGSNQHVGNFPGVTVDRKDGEIKGYPNTLVTDLPGIYSLSPYTSEEIVSRQFILNDKPTGIINIVDVTNIERNLYLTMQLMELDIPMVLAVNMMDEFRNNGGTIYINEIENMLGIPVVPIAAAKNEGIRELINHALHVSKYQEKPGRVDFCDAKEHGGAIHRCLHGIMHLIEDHAVNAGIPVRFAATKIVEGDEDILNSLKLSQNEKEMIEHIICQMEEERGLDRQAAIADMRFAFIRRLVDASVVKPKRSLERVRTQIIDNVLTGKYTAIPIFIAIMAFVFWMTFNVIGAWLQGLAENAVDYITQIADRGLTALKINEVVHSLVIDGIFAGVGSVISFLPIIVTLFFFLSMLEDTGYMARVAFVMDKMLRKIGLSGRSIVPMLIGFGCSVPGIMASRTLPSQRDRKMTITMLPFMSCTAKLPIYAYFTSVFFPKSGALVMILLYFIGIMVGILTAYVSKGLIFKGEAVPFVMELPTYRMPGFKNVMLLLWDKAKDFLQKAFTIIFVATVVVWFLQTFGLRLNVVTDSKDSILAMIAGIIAPIFIPLGFGDWRISTALISGFMAKESVVSTVTVLFGSSDALLAALSPDSAFALLVFCLLYTPCIAAVSAIRREVGKKWALRIVFFQCSVAWVGALLARIIALGMLS